MSSPSSSSSSLLRSVLTSAALLWLSCSAAKVWELTRSTVLTPAESYDRPKFVHLYHTPSSVHAFIHTSANALHHWSYAATVTPDDFTSTVETASRDWTVASTTVTPRGYVAVPQTSAWWACGAQFWLVHSAGGSVERGFSRWTNEACVTDPSGTKAVVLMAMTNSTGAYVVCRWDTADLDALPGTAAPTPDTWPEKCRVVPVGSWERAQVASFSASLGGGYVMFGDVANTAMVVNVDRLFLGQTPCVASWKATVPAGETLRVVAASRGRHFLTVVGGTGTVYRWFETNNTVVAVGTVTRPPQSAWEIDDLPWEDPRGLLFMLDNTTLSRYRLSSVAPDLTLGISFTIPFRPLKLASHPSGHLLGLVNKDTTLTMFLSTTAACSVAPDIGSCIGDPEYCGWWLRGQTCLRLSEAVNHPRNEIAFVSPKLLSIFPSTGSISGGTSIAITVDTLFYDPGTALNCSFGGVMSPATLNDATKTITCVTPQVPVVTPGSVLQVYDVNLLYKGKTVAKDSLKFNFYDCSKLAASCGTCTSFTPPGASHIASECGWLPVVRQCVSTVSGEAYPLDYTPIVSSSGCPAIKSAAPLSGEATQDTNVTITLNKLVPGTLYGCFVGTDSVPAASSTANSITCTVPKFAVAPINLVAKNLTVWAKPVSLPESAGLLYVDSDAVLPSVQFTWYSCRFFTECGSCSGAQTCSWCVDPAAGTLTCFNHISQTCAGTAFDTNGSCPRLLERTPDSVDLETPVTRLSREETASDIQVSLRVSTVFPGFEYTCRLTPSTGAPVSVNATVVDTTLSCSIPRPSSGELRYGLEVFAGATLYLTTPDFWFFNCSSHTSTACTTGCTAHASNRCGWCVATKKGSCSALTRCGGEGCWSPTQCPALSSSVLPNFYNVDEGSRILFTGTTFPGAASARSFICQVFQMGKNTSLPATFVSTTEMACSLPALSASQIVGLTNVDVALTEDQPLDTTYTAFGRYALAVVSCGFSSATTCGSCMAYVPSPQCVWGRGDLKCTTTDRATFPVFKPNAGPPNCPALASIFPTYGMTSGGAPLTISGMAFINTTSVALRFLSDDKVEYTAAVVLLNETTMTSVSPSAQAGKYRVSVSLNGQTYAENSEVTFEFIKKKSNPAWIIALSTTLAVLVVGAAVVLLTLFLVRKFSDKGGSRFMWNARDEPDYPKFAYLRDFGSSGQTQVRIADQFWHDLATILQDPTVAGSVLDSTQPAEADRVANALVYITASRGNALKLLNSLVAQEVRDTRDDTQLFRSNSMCSKAFRAFSKLAGLRYLWLTFGRFLGELEHLANEAEATATLGHAGTAGAAVAPSSAADAEMQQLGTADLNESGKISILTTDIEIDPTRLSSGADEETQAYLLAQRSRALLLMITKSTNVMPPQLRWFVHQVRAHVQRRFPGSENIAVGGLIFLRFICPALTLPHAYGLLKQEPKPRLQRQLVLVSKVLQNLANNVLFGVKETFMASMNEFIVKNLAPLQEWMAKLGEVGNECATEAPTSVPQDVMSGSLSFLRTHLSATLDRVIESMGQRQVPQDVQQRFKTVVTALQ